MELFVFGPYSNTLKPNHRTHPFPTQLQVAIIFLFKLSQDPRTWHEMFYYPDGLAYQWYGKIERSLDDMMWSNQGVQKLLFVLMCSYAIEVLNIQGFTKHRVFWRQLRVLATQKIIQQNNDFIRYLCLVRGLEKDSEKILGKFKNVLVKGEIYFTVFERKLEWIRHSEGELIKASLREQIPSLAF